MADREVRSLTEVRIGRGHPGQHQFLQLSRNGLLGRALAHQLGPIPGPGVRCPTAGRHSKARVRPVIDPAVPAAFLLSAFQLGQTQASGVAAAPVGVAGTALVGGGGGATYWAWTMICKLWVILGSSLVSVSVSFLESPLA